MRRHLALYLLAISFVLGVNPKAPAQEPEDEEWSFTSFDAENSLSTIIYDVNDVGDMVGVYKRAGDTFDCTGRGPACGDHGWLKRGNGEFTPIDVPGADVTRALGINSHGDIVGPYRLASEATLRTRHGFIRSKKGTFTTFEVPNAVFTQPLGINDRSDIVGRFCFTVEPVPCPNRGAETHGFLRTAEGKFFQIDVPGARQTTAWKIDARGQILGSYWGADGKIHVFLLSDDNFTTIDLPFEPAWENGGMTTRGDIVGYFCVTASPCFSLAISSGFRGFLLSRDGDFTAIDFPDAKDTFVLSTNPSGDLIVGSYRSTDGKIHGFIAAREKR